MFRSRPQPGWPAAIATLTMIVMGVWTYRRAWTVQEVRSPHLVEHTWWFSVVVAVVCGTCAWVTCHLFRKSIRQARAGGLDRGLISGLLWSSATLVLVSWELAVSMVDGSAFAAVTAEGLLYHFLRAFVLGAPIFLWLGLRLFGPVLAWALDRMCK